MVKYKNGELVVGLLDDTKVLSKETIKNYDYKAIKEDFDEIVELLEMNKLFYSIYEEKLKYEITDDLEFKIFINPSIKTYTCDSLNEIISETDSSLLTMDKRMYEQYYSLCEMLLIKVKNSWSHLNEVEKFIIKSLEFDNPKSNDDELEAKLLYCNKKYYQYKKSGFIKMGTQLQLEEAKHMKNSLSMLFNKNDKIGNKISNIS
jgi:hypothetical protein